MKRLLPLLALLLSAPLYAANDVRPTYPDLILQSNVTATAVGAPQKADPVAYRVVATVTGVGAVSATVKVYCKSANLGIVSGTQSGSDISLTDTTKDTDTLDVTSGCPYMYSEVSAISGTSATVDVTATPIYASAGASTNANAGQYADDADFTDGTSVSVLAGGVADVASSIPVTEGDVGAFAMTLHRGLKTSIYTPNDDSAMDDTADAVKVLNYVSENAATATAADVDQTGAKTIITVDVGAVQASRLYCIFQNTDVAANTTLDEFNIYLAPAGYTATSMPVAYTEADFASPSGALLMVRTGAGGDTTDATPDTTLDESDYMIVWLDVSGMDSVTFQASAAADNAAVDAKCTYN